jgi:hypothetical protein
MIKQGINVIISPHLSRGFMNRTIEIAVTEEFWDATAEVKWAERDRAIGHFCTWGIQLEKYRKLSLYCARDGSINATYRDEAGNVTYSMAAILKSDNTYGFHS